MIYARLVEPAGVEPASPACRAGILPLDDDPIKHGGPDGNRTRLDPARQAGGIPRCLRDLRVTTGIRTRTKRFTASRANRYTMATVKQSARGESNADLPVIGRLHYRCATGR